MVLQALGAEALVRLMRLERVAERDASWLLHGPALDSGETEEAQADQMAWRHAAE